MATHEDIPFGRALPFEIEAEPTVANFAGSARSALDRRTSIIRGRILMADLPVVPSAAGRMLPLGMRLADPPQARLFVASYQKGVYADAYNEAAVMFSVRTFIGEGGHVGWIVVDDDAALAMGREFLACPKKMADIAYFDDGERVTAGVTRRGIDLFKIEATRRREEESPDFVFGAKAFNAGGPGQLTFLNPIWLFRLTEVIHESWAAEAMITFSDSVYDPIAGWFAASGAVPARIVTIDVTSLRYMFPVGITGPWWFLRVYNTRYR